MAPSISQDKIRSAAPNCYTCDDLKDDLDQFSLTCESCIGPNGTLKMITSTSGALVTTSSSNRLWNLIEFDHPFAEFVIQASKNISDHKLYFASFATRLLKSNAKIIDHEKVVEIIEKAAVNIDVGKLNHMISIARSIMKTKAKSAGLLTNEVDALSVKIVEAWLKSLPEESDELGEVVVKVHEGGGSDNAVVTKGLLYGHDPTYDDSIQNIKGPIKVAIFNLMLDKFQSGEEWTGLELEYDRTSADRWEELDIVPQLRGLGVGLVCCQKVIGQGVKRRLEQEGITVVDRLGTAGHDRLVRMSGATSVSSIHYRLKAGDMGCLDILETIEIKNKKYIRLDNKDSGQVSLNVGSLGEDQAEELENVIKKALDGLVNLVTQKEPKVLPGGGCLESILALQLGGNQEIQKTLMKLALVPSRLNIAESFIDLKHGHLWAGEEKNCCVCGLSTYADNLALVPALEIYTNTSPSKPVEPIPVLPNSKQLIVDCFTVKKDSILLALETAENLSNIGMILTC